MVIENSLWEKSQFDLIKVIRCYLGNYYSAEYDMVSEFQAICNLRHQFLKRSIPRFLAFIGGLLLNII